MQPQGLPVQRKGLERHSARIVHAERPSDSLVLLRLQRPAGYSFDAGQFLYAFQPEGSLKRAYSIASAPYEADHLDLCVKRVEQGPMSSYLYGLQTGSTMAISKALGAFRFATPPGVPAVFLATGTGVAPFRAMISQLLHDHDTRELWLFLGSREEKNLPYASEFRGLADFHPNFHFVPVLSGSPVYWMGDRGWIQEAFLKRFHDRGTSFHAYICGVRRMVDDVRVLLLERGLPAESVHVERYD